MRFIAIVIGFAIVAAGTATGQGRSGTPAPVPAAPLEPRIASLEAQIKKLTAALEEAKSQNEAQGEWLNGLSASIPPTTYVDLDCANGKYSQMQAATGFAMFFVKCSKIEPYLEGFKVTVSIGNPYGISFTDFTGQIGYGATFADAAKQKATMSSTATFAPGVWTNVVVTLNPAAAKDVRKVMILSVDFAGLRMQ